MNPVSEAENAEYANSEWSSLVFGHSGTSAVVEIRLLYIECAPPSAYKPVFLRRVLYCDFPHSHHCALVLILFEHVHDHYSDGWTESEQSASR